MADSGNTNNNEDILLNEVHKKVSVLQELYIKFFKTLTDLEKMRVLREGIINAFQAAYADTQTAFATRQAEALNMYNLEIDQRPALEGKHIQLRTTQIEPLRKNIEKFRTLTLF